MPSLEIVFKIPSVEEKSLVDPDDLGRGANPRAPCTIQAKRSDRSIIVFKASKCPRLYIGDVC